MTCTYSSTRTTAVCTEPVEVTYGTQGFCKKHSITVQALLVKQAHSVPRDTPNDLRGERGDHTTPSAKSKKTYELVIKRNKRGNFTDERTNFVFNPITKKVIGFEDEDGDVIPLTDAQKLVCLKRNWAIHDPKDDSSSDENEGEYESEEEYDSSSEDESS
jgi:hypothetical protein